MEWVDGNLGSKVTMKYPAIWLMGQRAHGEVLSIAFAGKGQHQDAAQGRPRREEHHGVITSKSISKNGGRGGYRGLLEVAKGPPARSRRSSATR
jgi:Fe-S cluster assembly protein SufB